jgi:hypothetical protein
MSRRNNILKVYSVNRKTGKVDWPDTNRINNNSALAGKFAEGLRAPKKGKKPIPLNNYKTKGQAI